MEYITKPSITRLARRAGVKSISEECYTVIHDSIGATIKDIVGVALIINKSRSTKTLMEDDIHDALRLKGYNTAQSTDLGSGTCLR
jgi:histone H3/H4